MLEIVKATDRNGTTTRSASKESPGNCALIMFYGRTCPFSAEAVGYFSAMAELFPDIRFGAVDAYRFHMLNADLGVVAVPTMVLFHEGRTVTRYLRDGTTFNTSLKNVVGIRSNCVRVRRRYEMIKLFSLKQQKKDGGGGQTSKTGGTQKKASAAQLRVQKGMPPRWKVFFIFVNF